MQVCGNVRAACAAAGMSRATFYRRRNRPEKPERSPRPASSRALSESERGQVLSVLHEPRFVDKAPGQVYATLLDEHRYICSISTMYRILRTNREVRERRNIARHPEYKKPELLATGPNQVWSWDITKLRGPQKWNHYHLYVITDIYSRYVVGWMVAPRESAELAKELIRKTCQRQGVNQNELVIHSDRGPSMNSRTVAQLLADLGVTKSLSRPHVSNDNPYSESLFKTLKYCPPFPDRFGCIADARAFLRKFFAWYNNDHKHSGIALMTPFTVHYGFAAQCNRIRSAALLQAFAAHPERFVKGKPKPLELPKAAWINEPKKTEPEHSVAA